MIFAVNICVDAEYNRRMKKFLTPVCGILCLAVLGFNAFLLFGSQEEAPETPQGKTVLNLWNIDSFEGGRGSRTAFLKKAARGFEKRNDGLYIMVASMTAEGCAYEMSEGNFPDMVSFGVGTEVTDNLLALSSLSFAGGNINGKCYAYPWCRGGYVLYSLAEDFSAVSCENTVISLGGSNLPVLSACLNGLSGEYPTEASTTAYVDFINGKYRYLLGTQRDYFRFRTRNVKTYAKALDEYNDLYQYIAVCGEENGRASLDFVKYLLSEEVQSALSEIGMCAMNGDYAEDELLKTIESAEAVYSVSVFMSKENLKNLADIAREELLSGEIKKIKNYLKTVA